MKPSSMARLDKTQSPEHPLPPFAEMAEIAAEAGSRTVPPSFEIWLEQPTISIGPESDHGGQLAID